MAGRGTDITLGVNVDSLTEERLRSLGLHPEQTPDEYKAAWSEVRAQVKAETASEVAEVAALGGLYVLGTERHESRRIDNQLRGRAGRQGDPGETKFYLSLRDELMRRFSSVNLYKLMSRLHMPDDEAIKSNAVTRAVRGAQTQIEQENFEMRMEVLKYDETIDKQRKVVYKARSRILTTQQSAIGDQ